LSSMHVQSILKLIITLYKRVARKQLDIRLISTNDQVADGL
jgi:hypothetical protein